MAFEQAFWALLGVMVWTRTTTTSSTTSKLKASHKAAPLVSVSEALTLLMVGILAHPNRCLLTHLGSIVFGGIDIMKYSGPLQKQPIIPRALAPDGYAR